jgi:hypothetical protein
MSNKEVPSEAIPSKEITLWKFSKSFRVKYKVVQI